MNMNVLVLIRQTDGTGDQDAFSPVVMGVYDTLAQVEERMAKVAKANSQYRLRRLGTSTGAAWRLGPEDDEGFFGNRPMTFWAFDTVYHPETAQ